MSTYFLKEKIAIKVIMPTKIPTRIMPVKIPTRIRCL